ncbi:MAG: relaxase/mobilization nuclease domain-containing protein [Psychrosphaera sp.]|nr:relaxase/mobilization nuclease domain-containing protein [Psychrosphaera sp.]
MIIKASKRGGSKQLALHLLSTDNDHVEVMKVDGFVSNNLTGALHEMYAVSRGTKAQKFMLSVSFNPPEEAVVSRELLENTVARSLKKLNLENQPYCLVAHEKEGRRHYHCVVSLIDTQKMKAIKPDFFKQRLNDIANDLFLENGWKLPNGFKNQGLSDPRNFSLAEWQQAKRAKRDPKQIKATLQQSWKAADNKTSFKHALAESGFFLAQGDRRGYVAIDWQGEVYSLSRALGVKTKALKIRLGEREALPSTSQIKAKIADEQTHIHHKFVRELAFKHKLQRQPFKREKATIIKTQRQERETLKVTHEARHTVENKQRLASIRKGWLGLFDFVTGRSSKQHKLNEAAAKACAKRDQSEKDTLVKAHLNKRQTIQGNYTALRQRHHNEKAQLNTDFVCFAEGLGSEALKRRFTHAAQAQEHSHKPNQAPEIGL